MHFIFLTRCFKPDNIQAIKDSIKSTFESHDEHTYKHVLLVDMSHTEAKEDQFDCFVDNYTDVHYVRKKKDHYMYNDVSDYLETVEDREAYVYLLDDDNIIKPDFIKVCDTSENVDLIIFKLDDHEQWGKKGCGSGSVDIGNYITKLSILKKYKFDTNESSRCADGRFVERLRENKCSIIYINEYLGYYNKLRP